MSVDSSLNNVLIGLMRFYFHEGDIVFDEITNIIMNSFPLTEN